MKKLENEIFKSKTTTTFVDWSNPVKTGHPKEYFNIKDRELLDIINSKHLFGRKFNKDCNLINNQSYINFITKDCIFSLEKRPTPTNNYNSKRRIPSRPLANNDNYPTLKESVNNTNTRDKFNFINENNNLPCLKMPIRNTNTPNSKSKTRRASLSTSIPCSTTN